MIFFAVRGTEREREGETERENTKISGFSLAPAHCIEYPAAAAWLMSV